MRLEKALRKLFRYAPLPTLDESVAGMERVFRAPPLTRELVTAIQLISPQFQLFGNERNRRLWEADQNGACWGEFEALQPLLRTLPAKPKVLEVGPGMGRSLVFFSKKLGWQSGELHAYDGEGDNPRYELLGERGEDSFCGNLSALKTVLRYNRVENCSVFNARDIPLAEMPGPYDLIYSFYSIGFHWSLEHYLDDLLRLMEDRSIAVFTVPREFQPFPELDALHYRVIDWKPVWPKGVRHQLLVVGKSALPGDH